MKTTTITKWNLQLLIAGVTTFGFVPVEANAGASILRNVASLAPSITGIKYDEKIGGETCEEKPGRSVAGGEARLIDVKQIDEENRKGVWGAGHVVPLFVSTVKVGANGQQEVAPTSMEGSLICDRCVLTTIHGLRDREGVWFTGKKDQPTPREFARIKAMPPICGNDQYTVKSVVPVSSGQYGNKEDLAVVILNEAVCAPDQAIPLDASGIMPGDKIYGNSAPLNHRGNEHFADGKPFIQSEGIILQGGTNGSGYGTYHHTGDTESGDSGMGYYRIGGGKRALIGVHGGSCSSIEKNCIGNGEHWNRNWGVKITPKVIQRIERIVGQGKIKTESIPRNLEGA